MTKTLSPELEERYAVESARLVRQRFAVVTGLFIVLMGLGSAFDAISHPDRRTAVIAFWLLESAIVCAGLLIMRVPALVQRAALIGAVLGGVVGVLITYYHVLVGSYAERTAMTLGLLLNGLAVLVPWGAWAQAVGASFALVAFAVLAPSLATPIDSWVISWLGVAVASVTSVVGAAFFERYRFEAFRRASLHAEEAEIAATLLKVTETVSTHLGSGDVLEQVNRLAAETLGCDWSTVFLFDDGRHAYRLAATAGVSPGVRTLLEQTEFAADSLPLLQAFRAGTLIEIERPEGQFLVPPTLLRSFETASALYAPIGRGERIVGVIVNGNRTRVGRFSARQRRLALGIAHAVAVALENARLIETLQGANRLKSDFVATMSHELRTPLNVIIGYSEMLAEGLYPPGTDGWRDTLDRIQRASAELMDLISATLDMGRLEAGRELVTLGPLDLRQLLAEVEREAEPLVPASVRLVTTNLRGADPVVTDGAKVKTIVKNLVGNALKFTTAGSVEVISRIDGDSLVLCVRDTGIGIAPEYLPVIFDMFRQVDGSTTRRYGGVGLGLHIVKRLASLLGGTIDVASEVGRGSTFTVTIPVSGAAPQRATGT